MTRVQLTEADFRTLVKGGEVTHDGAVVILADIGIEAMANAVNDAISEIEARERGEVHARFTQRFH